MQRQENDLTTGKDIKEMENYMRKITGVACALYEDGELTSDGKLVLSSIVDQRRRDGKKNIYRYMVPCFVCSVPESICEYGVEGSPRWCRMNDLRRGYVRIGLDKKTNAQKYVIASTEEFKRKKK